MADATPAPDKLNVKVNSVDTELFMSFALLNRLQSFFTLGDGDVTQLLVNPFLQEGALKIVFARTAFKDILIADIDIESLKLTREDASSLFEWIQNHVLDFLLKGLTKTASLAKRSSAVMDQVKKTIEEVTSSSTPSLTGTKA